MEEFNNKLKINQYDENYLIDNLKYFNSNICLEYQKQLSPYFCFRYLYDNKTEPIKNRVYYNDIIEYFKNKQNTNDSSNDSANDINKYVKIYDIAMRERYNNQNIINEIKLENNKTINLKYEIKPLFVCDGDCNKCIDKYCDF